MKTAILVPWTKYPAELRTVLLGLKAKFVFMDSDSAYFELLAEQWQKRESTLIIEHDILPDIQTVWEILGCNKPWCVAPYLGPGGILLKESLGCTKFSSSAMARTLSAFDNILADQDSEPFSPTDWRRLDVRLAKQLKNVGLTPHLHDEVKHLHVY